MAGKVFGGTAQRLAAKQENHNDDDEDEANRTAANIEGTGKNRREYEMHSVFFVLMGMFTITFSGYFLSFNSQTDHSLQQHDFRAIGSSDLPKP